jgi:hypothetical protein
MCKINFTFKFFSFFVRVILFRLIIIRIVSTAVFVDLIFALLFHSRNVIIESELLSFYPRVFLGLIH